MAQKAVAPNTLRVHTFTTRPTNLPDHKSIIEECRQAYLTACSPGTPGDKTYPLRGIVLSNKSAFVKFAPTVRFREAEIQDYVGGKLKEKGSASVRVPVVFEFIQWHGDGSIVMELIHGTTCNDTHVVQVARALEELIAIEAPTMAPGPKHLNRILAREGHTERLDLVGEVEQLGLRLCPADLDATNFMVDSENGMIVAIDFGQTSFLPPCFFNYAITVGKPYANLAAALPRGQIPKVSERAAEPHRPVGLGQLRHATRLYWELVR
ncbi:hypothetical protein C8Q76DRAFT_688287 [Earliella scabrosa]|nr:hypothetical protein C8Q76DRAFT_688287 [Earliella scabrosa]